MLETLVRFQVLWKTILLLSQHSLRFKDRNRFHTRLHSAICSGHGSALASRTFVSLCLSAIKNGAFPAGRATSGMQPRRFLSFDTRFRECRQVRMSGERCRCPPCRGGFRYKAFSYSPNFCNLGWVMDRPILVSPFVPSRLRVRKNCSAPAGRATLQVPLHQLALVPLPQGGGS